MDSTNNSRRFLPAILTLALAFAAAFSAALNAQDGVAPKAPSSRVLNLDFETGDLRDWKAQGEAFQGQPIQGDTVKPRRSDMESRHVGEYWIGGYEIHGDKATGSLTSAAFSITHPYAAFRVAGGASEETRVELLFEDGQEVFFKISGYESENLRPAVVDLRKHQGKEMRVRLMDEAEGHWGHLNFDHFRFFAQRPRFDNELTPESVREQQAVPPVDVVRFEGLTAQQAVDVVSMPDGFDIHVFAAEPDVRQPIAFCIDHRGRLWVAEGYQYPKRAPEGEGRDRILIFEDTNGDHRFDRRTVFKENLNLISGLEVGFGGVWVGAAPYLMFIPDRDGDDIPDGEPEIHLDGWDYLRDTHETLNTFCWGPDGWLYGCHGVFCPSHVGAPGTPMSERQRVDAAVWRYHPVKREFEVFAEGTSNPWGVDFDEYGQCVIEACVIPHLWHMIQGARYQRQGGRHYSINLEEAKRNRRYLPDGAPDYVNPFIYEDIKTIGDHVHYAGNRGPHAGNNRSDSAGGGHAHAGLMMYLGGSWPEMYRNNAFMHNIHGQRINMDNLEREGSGYRGTHGEDFLNFNDKWSQALNLLYDQDGSVFVIDWYDKNQCHHNRIDGHDRSNGRIFKIVYQNQPVTRVDLKKRTDLELARLQLSRNEWRVRHARRILQERSAEREIDPSAVNALNETLQDHEKTDRRLRALWALHVTGNLTGQASLKLLSDPDEHVRAWTIQLIGEDKKFNQAVLDKMKAMAENDPSPMARLYLASALQRMPLRQRVPILSGLLRHEEDIQDHNLPLMYWYAAEPVVGEDAAVGIQLLSQCKIPLVRQYITRRMASFASIP